MFDGMKIQNKFWIEQDGIKIFGKGPCTLLEMVERMGSLNKAARKLNMSYSKAWSIINRAENVLGYSLLETKTGGAEGGGSCLTYEARVLIENYKKFQREAEESTEQIFKMYFGKS